MPTYTLERTGQRPLPFEGELLATVTGDPGRASRWNALELYRTQAGTLLLSIQYHTKRKEESSYYSVREAPTMADAEAILMVYDPCDHVQGFPEFNDALKLKQARLFQELRSRYQSLVSELLKQFPELVD
jgi:hypothetical protein